MPSTEAVFDITGNVGKDPETKELNGAKRTSINLAHTKKWTDKSGEKHEETFWHTVTAWRQVAEILSQYVSKGDKLRVKGNIEPKVLEGDDGEKKYVVNFTVTDFYLQGSKGGNGSNGNNKPAQRTDNYSPNGGDDIPF
jgi:single-strand DNA-binding protein